MKIGIVGSRNFPNLGIVAEYVRKLPKGTIIVSGGARGVDKTAAVIAHEYGLTVEEFLPNWKEHGTAAGFIRNDEIVDASARIVAFWDGQSGGTLDTIEKARAAGVPVTVILPNGSHFDEKPTNEDAFDNDDPQDGATRDEYEDTQARESADDYNPPSSDRIGTPKVKLLTTSLKWICAAKPKERKTTDGATRQYFTQTLFTVRGNCVVLSYDNGTHPLTAGPGKGVVVEIFGRTKSDPEPREDGTQLVFINGAEVITRRTVTKPPHSKTAPAISAKKIIPRELVDLRSKMTELDRQLRWDDTREVELQAAIEELAIKIRRLENGSTDTEEELRSLIKEQIRDCNDSAAEIDKEESDADEDADILDHDDDGDELERATEPWADSSIPFAATLDRDCYTCPARIGATCGRTIRGEVCLFA